MVELYVVLESLGGGASPSARAGKAIGALKAERAAKVIAKTTNNPKLRTVLYIPSLQHNIVQMVHLKLVALKLAPPLTKVSILSFPSRPFGI